MFTIQFKVVLNACDPSSRGIFLSVRIVIGSADGEKPVALRSSQVSSASKFLTNLKI